MIIDMIQGDVIISSLDVLAFATNTEGLNDSGFAGMIARKYWQEIGHTSPSHLGTWKHKNVEIGGEQVTLVAITCHTLEKDGWKDTPEVLSRALDRFAYRIVSMPIPGSGLVGKMQGANVLAIMGGIARSQTKVKLYTL